MNIKKYDKIKQVGDVENKDILKNPESEICIQEKVDGANTRVLIHNGKLIFGSRTRQLTSDEGEDTNVEKSFIRSVNYIRDKLKDKDLSKYEGYTLFFETMVKHTLSYNWEVIPPAIGFDVYKDDYLHWDDAQMIFNELGIEFVPFRVYKASEVVLDDSIVPETKWPALSTDDKLAEGVVLKRFNPRIYAKYVRNEFKEKNHKVFGQNKKFAKDDSEYFVSIYCTNARIDKCVFKLLDDGKELGMQLMGDLLNLVYSDIWEENWRELAYSKKIIDTNKFKKLISKRVLEVLKQVIINNAL